MGFWRTYLLALLVPVNFITANDVIAAFQRADIIPEIIDAEQMKFLKVTYGDVQVNLGNELTPTQVIDEPTVTWESDSVEYSYSTLVMIDADVPSRTNQSFSELVHWLVGNIRGGNINKGDTIVEYVGSAPPLGAGMHRYIFLVFTQPGKLTFDEPRLEVNGTGMARTRFSIRTFAEKYQLGQPEAGNYFYAQYDNSVNKTLHRLGFNGF